MLSYIVFPKIRRVLRGERVVVSHVLREMATGNFGSDSEATNNVAARQENVDQEGTDPVPTEIAGTDDPHFGAEETGKLVMKKDGPLPVEVEYDMYLVEEIIGSLRRKCLSGRAIHANDLQSLRDAASSLSTMMSRVNYISESSGLLELPELTGHSPSEQMTAQALSVTNNDK